MCRNLWQEASGHAPARDGDVKSVAAVEHPHALVVTSSVAVSAGQATHGTESTERVRHVHLRPPATLKPANGLNADVRWSPSVAPIQLTDTGVSGRAVLGLAAADEPGRLLVAPSRFCLLLLLRLVCEHPSEPLFRTSECRARSALPALRWWPWWPALLDVYRPPPKGGSEDGSAQLGRQSKEAALSCRPIAHTSHLMCFKAQDAA